MSARAALRAGLVCSGGLQRSCSSGAKRCTAGLATSASTKSWSNAESQPSCKAPYIVMAGADF